MTPLSCPGTDRINAYGVQETLLQPFNRLFVFSDGAYEIVRQDGSMLTLEDFIHHLFGRIASGADDLQTTVSYLEKARGISTFEDDLAVLEASLS